MHRYILADVVAAIACASIAVSTYAAMTWAGSQQAGSVKTGSSFAPGGAPKVINPTFVLNSAAPGPRTWAMMLVGFIMVSGAVRYRRQSIRTVSA